MEMNKTIQIELNGIFDLLILFQNASFEYKA